MAMRTAEIIANHPDVKGAINDALISCIDECYACSQACLSCADACLAEDDVAALRQCIRFNQDCADICDTTAKIAARRTGWDETIIVDMLAICADMCRRCDQECSRHAHHHAHCDLCAKVCRNCETACRQALSGLGEAQPLPH
jgi:hypothetical protein